MRKTPPWKQMRWGLKIVEDRGFLYKKKRSLDNFLRHIRGLRFAGLRAYYKPVAPLKMFF